MATQRHMYFVGSYPSAIGSDVAAMEDMMKQAGPHVLSLPGGETQRPNWIVKDLQLLERNPDIEVVKKENYRDYDHVTRFRLRKGHELNPDNLDLRYYSEDALKNWPAFVTLRKKYQRPDLPYLVGFPGSLQDPLFAFGARGFLPHYRRPFELALKREAFTIFNNPAFGKTPKEKNHNLVWQIEIPAEVGGLAKIPRVLQPLTSPLLAPLLVKGVVRQIADLPNGARVVIHACNGDANHTGFSNPSSSAIAVILIQAIVQQWPKGRSLYGIHVPFGSGDHPPTTDKTYYRPLSKLATTLPKHTRFIAGFVHEQLSQRDLITIRNTIEYYLGRKIDIAYTCGFGRVSLDVARQVTEKCITIVGNLKEAVKDS